jgi:hypothetical protein
VLSLDDTLRCRPEVASRPTPDGAVLVDLVTGNCFELNGVGRLMWAELASPRPLARVCDSMLAMFDVPRDVIERDVLALAEELRRAGLVELAGPARGAAAR